MAEIFNVVELKDEKKHNSGVYRRIAVFGVPALALSEKGGECTGTYNRSWAKNCQLGDVGASR